jgi:hypothetical protein
MNLLNRPIVLPTRDHRSKRELLNNASFPIDASMHLGSPFPTPKHHRSHHFSRNFQIKPINFLLALADEADASVDGFNYYLFDHVTLEDLSSSRIEDPYNLKLEKPVYYIETNKSFPFDLEKPYDGEFFMFFASTMGMVPPMARDDILPGEYYEILRYGDDTYTLHGGYKQHPTRKNYVVRDGLFIFYKNDASIAEMAYQNGILREYNSHDVTMVFDELGYGKSRAIDFWDYVSYLELNKTRITNFNFYENEGSSGSDTMSMKYLGNNIYFLDGSRGEVNSGTVYSAFTDKAEIMMDQDLISASNFHNIFAFSSAVYILADGTGFNVEYQPTLITVVIGAVNDGAQSGPKYEFTFRTNWEDRKIIPQSEEKLTWFFQGNQVTEQEYDLKEMEFRGILNDVFPSDISNIIMSYLNFYEHEAFYLIDGIMRRGLENMLDFRRRD